MPFGGNEAGSRPNAVAEYLQGRRTEPQAAPQRLQRQGTQRVRFQEIDHVCF